MIQLCRKDKEKVYEAIRAGKIDAADMALPNLIDDIILTMKIHGILELLSGALSSTEIFLIKNPRMNFLNAEIYDRM